MTHDQTRDTRATDRPSRGWWSKLGWLPGLLILAALIYLVATHLGEERKFVRLAEQAQPAWILAGVGLQVLTYACAGGVFHRVLKRLGSRVPTRSLALVALEQLSIDQLVPTAGMAGNTVVVEALRRRKASTSEALSVVLVNLYSNYLAYALVGAAAAGILWSHHHIHTALGVSVSVFAVAVFAVPLGILWLIHHRDWQPPTWMARHLHLDDFMKNLGQVEPGLLSDARLVVQTVALQAAIFLLDAATLWVMLQAVGTHTGPLEVFAAIVVASMAATISVIPGGIGTFEAGSTATLTLLGVPVEAALTATLLLRGLTLWIPLAPGLIMARRELHHA